VLLRAPSSWIFSIGVSSPLRILSMADNQLTHRRSSPMTCRPQQQHRERWHVHTRRAAEQLANSTDSRLGAMLFAQLGCSTCHSSTYKILPTGTPINAGTYRVPAELGGKIIHPYSDFCCMTLEQETVFRRLRSPSISINRRYHVSTFKLWRVRGGGILFGSGSYADGNNTGTSLIQYFQPHTRKE
jgi:hypothetical protein